MGKAIFTCDEEWWNSLSGDDQEKWLVFAEDCGAERKPNFCDRNTDYNPPLSCIPSVSLGLADDYILDILDQTPE